MLYEMMVGLTPFHSFEMKDLISKINDGRYKLSLQEPIYVETCLFLVQCLQMSENDRLPVEELSNHPYISEELINVPLTVLDIESFNNEIDDTSKTNVRLSMQSCSVMTGRFDDTVIKDTDVILTTKATQE